MEGVDESLDDDCFVAFFYCLMALKPVFVDVNALDDYDLLSSTSI